MMNFSRQPTYRSARAVPSVASSASPFRRIPAVRAIQIVLGMIAFVVMAINTFHIYPMFYAVDSDIMNSAHHIIGNAANLSDVSVDATDAMHHGVHKNLLEHKLSLRDHLEQRQQQQQQELNDAKFIEKEERIPNEENDILSIKDQSSGEAKGSPTTASTEKSGKSGQDPLNDILSLNNSNKKLARGFSGLPMEETPALIGAKRGTVKCDVDVKYANGLLPSYSFHSATLTPLSSILYSHHVVTTVPWLTGILPKELETKNLSVHSKSRGKENTSPLNLTPVVSITFGCPQK